MILTIRATCIFLVLFCATSRYVSAQKVAAIKSKVIFSAIKGSKSKPDTIALSADGKRTKFGDLKITGSQAKYFSMLPVVTKNTSNYAPQKIILVFAPDENFVGVATAKLVSKGLAQPIELTGLSTKALEGENEPPLSLVAEALGLTIDVGWTTLANHLRPELQGQELAPSLFQKATKGNIEMIPVARYSPDFRLNFGIYTPSANGPVQHPCGILATAGAYPEHQTLYPKTVSSDPSFDPGDQPFGFYAISPEHTVYSEDLWNMLFYPTHAAHAMRIYPLRDKQGATLENDYLVCMEEAANGDYNDYVFIVRNVKAIPISDYNESLLNGQTLEGWYTWIQGQGKNNDPEHLFAMEPNGVLHDQGSVPGYVMTEQAYGNFHLSLEFKWGEKRYPPRESSKRDSGICYNIPEDESDQIWPRSVECQIQEGDVGDFWLIGNTTIQVDGKQNQPLSYSQVVKKKDAEKPYGEWNTVEVISFNGKCVHVVNGVVVNYGENASVIGGRILLQSEYAEIYYRNVGIRKL